jgi:hypothetical protein
MKSSFLKKLVPHLLAAGIFLLIAVVYCSPVLQGKVVNQHDILGWKGMAQQSFEYKEKYGHFPLWSNSMFGGMPGYTIALDQKTPISIGYIYYLVTLKLPKPINYLWLACVCFYFLCQVLGVRPWLSVLGALAFAYSSFDPIIISVGHETQMQALATAPAVIASFMLLLQKKYWWGLSLLTIFFGLQVGSQHLQIVYYTVLLMGIIGISYFIYAIKQKQLAHAFTSFGLALIAGVIGFLTFAVSMLPLQEYSKETMRGGKSELTGDAKNKTKGGLDKDYAFQWSYGKNETFTLVVPNIYGGGSSATPFNSGSKFADKLTELGVPEENAIQMENGYIYWGAQTLGTSGPVYLGAVICFLFIFGLVYYRGWNKWWIIAASAIAILMAWGKNFSAFNYFLFDYLPFYSKFRAPTMALVIPQITFPLMAVLTVEQLLQDKRPRAEIWKQFRLSVFITGGILAILIFFYLGSDYKSETDTNTRDSFVSMLSRGNPQGESQAVPIAQGMMKALQNDRQTLFGEDLIRSFILILLTVLVIGAYLRNKIKETVLVISLILLSSFDLLAIGRRYLNKDSFIESDEFNAQLSPTAADQQIEADPNKPFRVYDATDPNGPYNSSRAANFHNSVGGYHPAKLGLYQDLIENQLSKGNMQVFNMLNTRYFIVENPQNHQAAAQLNPMAFGPAWTVKAIKYVRNADEEMKALDSTHIRDTAIVQEKFKPLVKLGPSFDSTATIKVKDYLNDIIRYDFNASTNQFVVFSEVYYDKGWNAFIDGQKAEYVKADYVLRGMSVPAGKHLIEFKFEPHSYELGDTLTNVTSILAYLLLITAIIIELRKKRITRIDPGA